VSVGWVTPYSQSSRAITPKFSSAPMTRSGTSVNAVQTATAGPSRARVSSKVPVPPPARPSRYMLAAVSSPLATITGAMKAASHQK
jgi:hypothetical protein